MRNRHLQRSIPGLDSGMQNGKHLFQLFRLRNSFSSIPSPVSTVQHFSVTRQTPPGEESLADGFYNYLPLNRKPLHAGGVSAPWAGGCDTPPTLEHKLQVCPNFAYIHSLSELGNIVYGKYDRE